MSENNGNGLQNTVLWVSITYLLWSYRALIGTLIFWGLIFALLIEGVAQVAGVFGLDIDLTPEVEMHSVIADLRYDPIPGGGYFKGHVYTTIEVQNLSKYAVESANVNCGGTDDFVVEQHIPANDSIWIEIHTTNSEKLRVGQTCKTQYYRLAD